MPELRIGIQLANLRLPFKKALQTAAQCGAQGVELDARAEIRPDELTGTGARHLRKMLEDLNLRACAVHFQTRRGYDTEEDLEPRIAATKQALQMAFRLGAEVVVNHVGRLPQTSDAPLNETLVQALADLGRYGQHVGAVLAADTGPDQPQALARLIDALPQGCLAVNLNPGNLIVHGRSPSDAVAALGEHIQHVHANDGVRDFARGRGLETQLGLGAADFAEIISLLEQRHYRGYYTVQREQSDNPTRDIAQAVRYLQGIVRS